MGSATSQKERTEGRALLKALLGGQEKDALAAADRLIAHFGSLKAAVVAPRREIARAAGDPIVVQRLVAVRQTMIACLRESIQNRPMIDCTSALLDYLNLAMSHNSVEQARALYLDSRNVLLREEELGNGSVDECPIYVREVITRALDLGASGIILVHNHPSGDPQPSRMDIDLTRRLKAAARTMDITLVDHLIVAHGNYVSFRHSNLI